VKKYLKPFADKQSESRRFSRGDGVPIEEWASEFSTAAWA